MRHLKVFTFIALLIGFVSAVCCSSKNASSSNEAASDSLFVAISNFKKDSLGCLGLRTKRTIEFIYSKGNIKGKSTGELLDLLGPQNDSVSANGLTSLKYYFNRGCLNGVPIDSVDRCWANFYVSTKKISNLGFVCE
jgi:hypothetical protein